MRLKAIVIIPRLGGWFMLRDAVIHRSWGFKGFSRDRVPAAYRRDQPIDGYGVALILQPSPVDVDFQVPTLFLREDELRSIREAMLESDRLTEKRLGRGWMGARPYLRLHHFM